MTRRERVEQLLKFLAYHKSYLGKVREVEAFARQEYARGLNEAATLIYAYNLDHDHGKKATVACDDLQEIIRQRATTVEQGEG